MARTRTNQTNPTNSGIVDDADNGDLSVIQLTSDIAPEPVESDNADNADSADVPAETGTDVAFDVNTLDLGNPDMVRNAYQTGTRKTKAAIRTFVTNAMNKAIDAMDLNAAKAAKDLNDSLVTVRPEKDVSAEYVRNYLIRVITVQNALNDLKSGNVDLPDGLDLPDNWLETVNAVNDGESDNTDLPDIDAKLYESLMSIRTGQKASKRSIVAHVTEWADSVESGHFGTIAEIAAFASNEYGTDNPSNGAVAAHFYGNGETAHDGSKYDKSELTGCVPDAGKVTGVRGARKL